MKIHLIFTLQLQTEHRQSRTNKERQFYKHSALTSSCQTPSIDAERLKWWQQILSLCSDIGKNGDHYLSIWNFSMYSATVCLRKAITSAGRLLLTTALPDTIMLAPAWTQEHTKAKDTVTYKAQYRCSKPHSWHHSQPDNCQLHLTSSPDDKNSRGIPSSGLKHSKWAKT